MRFGLLTALIGVAWLAALWGSIEKDSPTFDEPSHVSAGYVQLMTGDARFNRDQLPLPRLLVGLPYYLSGPHPNLRYEGEEWNHGDYWSFARQWVCGSKTIDQGFLTPGRSVVLFLFGLSAVFVYSLANSLGTNRFAASCTTLLYLFSPSLIGHARLATTDMPLVCAFVFMCWAFVTYQIRPTFSRLFLVALSLSAVVLSKWSWLGLAPGLVYWLFSYLRTRTQLQAAAAVVFLTIVTYVAVWGSNSFRYSYFVGSAEQAQVLPIVPSDEGMDVVWKRALEPQSLLGRIILPIVSLSRTHQLLPEPFLFSLASTVQTTEKRSSFLLGQISNEGFPHFFLWTFLTKSTLAELLITCFLPLTLLRVGRQQRLHRALCISFVSYLLLSLTSGLNVGHRHLLPLYPILYLLVVPQLAKKFRTGVVLLLVLQLASALSVFPRYVSYFNEIFREVQSDTPLLLDSNVDWGQDLLRARDHLGASAPVRAALFSSIPLQCYFPNGTDIGGFFPSDEVPILSPGTYLVSLNQMWGLYAPLARDTFWARDDVKAAYSQLFDDTGGREDIARMKAGRLLRALRSIPPRERIGDSLLVYELSEVDIERILSPLDGSRTRAR